MVEQSSGQRTRTAAKCISCESFYVAKTSSDGSFYLDGLAECPCGDAEIKLYEPSQKGIKQ